MKDSWLRKNELKNEKKGKKEWENEMVGRMNEKNKKWMKK